MDRYTSTTALGSPHLFEATSALRSELQRLITGDREFEVPDWSTLRVIGPFEVFDRRGGICFEYRGSVKARGSKDLPKHTGAARASRALPLARLARPTPGKFRPLSFCKLGAPSVA
jgi:hypothetical protein